MVMLVTPAGTVHVLSAPTYEQVTVLVVPTVAVTQPEVTAPAGEASTITDHPPAASNPRSGARASSAKTDDVLAFDRLRSCPHPWPRTSGDPCTVVVAVNRYKDFDPTAQVSRKVIGLDGPLSVAITMDTVVALAAWGGIVTVQVV